MLTLICCRLRQWIRTIFCCFCYYYYITKVAHSIDLTTVCVNKNLQSGLRIAHGSLMKAVCRPNPATPPTIWVVLSDWLEPKPHGSYVCTVGCSQIERRSSPLSTAHAVLVVIFLCTKCTLNSKNVLNIANDTRNAPENKTCGIMVNAYRGNFYEAKRWSHRPEEFELTRLLLENHDPSCEMLRFGGAVIKTCAKLYHFFPRGCDSTPQAHIDFDEMSGLHLIFL